MSTEADIAVLQNQYGHLGEKISEVQTEMRAGRKEMGDKLDTVLQTLIVQKATSQMRARIFTVMSHGATMICTLGAAKLMHIPLTFG